MHIKSRPCKGHTVMGLLEMLWNEMDGSNTTKYTLKQLDLYNFQLQLVGAKIRAARNSLQSIHTLPSEILVKIFTYCQETLPSYLPMQAGTEKYTGNYAAWLRLLHVCRHWRGIIATSPSLWTNIDSSLMPSKFLKRSAAAPITVYLGVRNSRHIPSKVINAVASQTRRIKQLHISLPALNNDSSIFAKFQARAPHVESLTIEVHYSGTSRNTPYFGPINPPAPNEMPSDAMFRGNYTSLRHLCLQHYLPPANLRHLTRVCLYDQGLKGQSTSKFLDFLDDNSNLLSLALINAGPDIAIQDDLPAVSPSRISRLSRLEELDLGDWASSSRISHFLSHLALPKTAKLYIWGTFLTNSDEEDIGAILPHNYSSLENIASISAWSFVRDDWPHPNPNSWGFYPRYPIIAFVEGTMYMRGLTHAAQIAAGISRFPLANITRFSLRETTDFSNRLDLPTWRDVLRQMPSLESVHLLSWRGADVPRQILSALTAPSSASSSSKSDDRHEVLCPSLQSLHVEDHDDSFPIFLLMSLLDTRSSQNHRLRSLTVTVHSDWFSSRTNSSAHSLSELLVDGNGEESDFKTLRKFVDDMVFLRSSVGDAYRDGQAAVSLGSQNDPRRNVDALWDEKEESPALPPGWPTQAFLWTRRRGRT